MTEGMLARDALERKKAWAFLEEKVLRLLASSPEFRELCREVLGGGRGFREFELDLRGALLGGAAAAVSEGLSALDGESGAPACGACGSAMVRRGTRSTAPRFGEDFTEICTVRKRLDSTVSVFGYLGAIA